MWTVTKDEEKRAKKKSEIKWKIKEKSWKKCKQQRENPSSTKKTNVDKNKVFKNAFASNWKIHCEMNLKDLQVKHE